MTRASFALLVSLVIGCSSSSSSGSSSFVSNYCDAFAPCCAKAGRPSDGSQCRAFIGAFTSSSSFNQAAADKCIADINAAKNNPDFCTSGSSTPSCSNVFKSTSSGGSKAPGETCDSDSDCAPSPEGTANCGSIFKSGMTIKKCQIVIVGKAGDSPCVSTIDGNITYFSGSSTSMDVPPKGYSCNKASGLRCDSTTEKCVALAKEGESCTSSDACSQDLYCPSGTDSKCTARKAAGQPCTFDECVKTAFCDSSATKTCVAKTPTGGACTTSTACEGGSCVNGKCGSNDLGLAFLCGGG
ncbi:MAG: hypothetical protein ACXVEF_19405 [Polyangiales bacterium]